MGSEGWRQPGPHKQQNRAGRSHTKCMHMKKDVIERRQFRESSHTFTGKSAQGCGSPDGLRSKAWGTNKRN